MNRHRFVLLYSFGAGLGDALTGVLLLAAPAATLQLMHVPVPAGELIWLRWMGVFVGAVGLSYLLPWRLPAPARLAELTVVWRFTAVVRGAVAVFVIGALLAAALPRAWLTVGLWDGLLAGLQVALLRAGWLTHD